MNTIVLNILVGLSLGIFCSYSAAEKHGIRIQEIRVQMFLSHQGRLSEPLTDKMILWNVPAGGGDVGESANSAFVSVHLSGPADHRIRDAQVHISIKEAHTGRLLVSRRLSVSGFNAAGASAVGYWINGVGCTPLRIEATYRGALLWKRVEFRCGE